MQNQHLTDDARRCHAVEQYQAALEGIAGHPDLAISVSVELPFCAAQCLCCEGKAQARRAMDPPLPRGGCLPPLPSESRSSPWLS